MSKTVTEKDKIGLRYQIEELQKMEDTVLTYSEDTTKAIKAIKESVLTEIETNGETYKDLIKYKHYFDKQ